MLRCIVRSLSRCPWKDPQLWNYWGIFSEKQHGSCVICTALYGSCRPCFSGSGEMNSDFCFTRKFQLAISSDSLLYHARPICHVTIYSHSSFIFSTSRLRHGTESGKSTMSTPRTSIRKRGDEIEYVIVSVARLVRRDRSTPHHSHDTRFSGYHAYISKSSFVLSIDFFTCHRHVIRSLPEISFMEAIFVKEVERKQGGSSASGLRLSLLCG